MAPAITQEGRTKIRDLIAAGFTHFGVATDTTAFADGQTELDPANGGAAKLLIKAATKTNVDANTVDVTIAINGTTEMTGENIATLGTMYGSTRADLVSRTVRANTIGVESGDNYTAIGHRWKVEDNS